MTGLAAPPPSAGDQRQETPAIAVPAPQPRAFRAATELVALQVSVVDGRQRYVSDLSADDFGVFEEGARQTVSVFAAATTPLDVMLLLDTSASMSRCMAFAQRAAIEFLEVLRPDDRAAVVLFDTNVRIVHPLSGNRRTLETALRGARPSGGTALHQAIYITLRELAAARRNDPQIRRQALVVLTDGEDTAPMVSFEDVLDEARRGAATIFVIKPPEPSIPASFRRSTTPRNLLSYGMRTLAEETGGRGVLPMQLADLPHTYMEIAEELSHQYWLGYAPEQSTGGFRHVSVRVMTRPGLRARTRSGYYASETARKSIGFGTRRQR